MMEPEAADSTGSGAAPPPMTIAAGPGGTARQPATAADSRPPCAGPPRTAPAHRAPGSPPRKAPNGAANGAPGGAPNGAPRSPSPHPQSSASAGLRPPPRHRSSSRPVFGALDLGTNNCRLLIARPSGRADHPFQIIDAFSRVVRLGEGLSRSGSLCDAAMDRTVAALSVCADKLARRGVTQVRSVATEACRQASNRAEFVRRVYAETGLALDIITPAEEARLVVLGCQTLIDHAAEQTLVFDIGGGSTEVALVRGIGAGGIDVDVWLSIPWGVVSLAETEAEDADCATARMAAYERMKDRVSCYLPPLARHLKSRPHLLGASGTVTTLTSLNMGLAQYDRSRVDGTLVPTAELVALARLLAAKPAAERARMPGISSGRAELLVAGAAILEALVELEAAPKLRVADRGIREGILRSMFGRLNASRGLPA